MKVVLGFVLGLAVGGLYFGALWLTLRRVPDADHPGGLVLVSYLMRLGVAGVGFYGVLRLGGAGALVAALVGFVVMRQLVIRRVGGRSGAPAAQEVPWS